MMIQLVFHSHQRATGLDDKYKFDPFIKRLFPTVRKDIYRDSGFVPWRKMMDEYKADKANWTRLEIEAQTMTTQIRQRALHTYDKEMHRFEIKKELNKSIKSILNKEDFDFRQSFKYWLK